MLGFETVEELPRRPGLSFFRVLNPLPNSLARVSASGNIKQALICLRVLDDSGSFALHCEHNGALTLFELFHEVARPPAKSRKRMNVLCDVKHGDDLPQHLFR